LDTNVVVAALVAEGLCREVVHRAVRMRILVSSARLMDELEDTLQRKFGVTPAARAFLKAFRQQVSLVEPVTLPRTICRDPDDDVVLATAIAANAKLIVTGDRDLLVLDAYEGVNIVSHRRFLEWLDAGSQ
jgi:putative PIN family toxin of toxin-antitoxin system